jgi:MarR family transcriptional regulator, organic hydroperoxide resistance regulator
MCRHGDCSEELDEPRIDGRPYKIRDPSPIERYALPVDPLLELALLVKAGQRELERRTNEAMQPLGLTAAQADALTVIGQAEPLSLKELGELLIAEAGHPSRLVDRLVASGLVQRRAAGDDRRRVELSLTPQGHGLEERVHEARQSVLDLGRRLVGDRDVAPALELMRELIQYSSFAELIERRRELVERDPSVARAR